jgi:hypothetical protein
LSPKSEEGQGLHRAVQPMMMMMMMVMINKTKWKYPGRIRKERLKTKGKELQ